MKYACRTLVYGGGCVVRLPTMTTGLSQHYLHSIVVHEVVDGACGIAATAYAGYQIVGIATACLLF